jgi:3-methyladenine DNA glycosylase AlkD
MRKKTTMVLPELRKELKQNSDPQARESGQKFFKEGVQLFGVKTATAHKISKAHFQKIKDRPKDEIYDLCEELWQSGYLEESFVACNWSYYIRNQYETADFQIFEKWVEKYVTNWASCDTLCNHTVGSFLDMYPEFVENLKSWAGSDNRWMRRGAAVSLIIPARNGRFHKQCLEIAGLLLEDKDDLVQKGYGWMLKVVSEADQSLVYDFVMKNKATMPRTALRYAIEKMPDVLRKKAMER